MSAQNGFAPIILIVGILATLMVGGTALLVNNTRTISPSPKPTPIDSPTPLPSGQSLLNTATSSALPVTTPPPLTPQTTVTTTSQDTKITKLENTITDLIARIKQLESQPLPTPAPSSTRSPIYIPLGPGTSVSSVDWSTASVPIITLNPADYPGYTNMQLEVTFQIFQANGTAYARLAVPADGTAVLSSQVSTTSSDYTTVTSSGFQLGSGQKTYKLQLKSTTGFSTNVQFARIKVNF
jgi:hypothetical protein